MKPDLSNEPTYNQAEKDFEVTYEITNPAFQLTWTRLWDSKMWRKQFRRVPTRKNLELKEYDNPPLSSDRKISNPFLHTFGHKYKNYQWKMIRNDNSDSNKKLNGCYCRKKSKFK